MSVTTATNIQIPPGPAEANASYRVGLSTLLRFRGRDRQRTTTAASRGGVFLESPDALPIGELVLALIKLPEPFGVLRALMTVERVVLPAEAAFCGGLPGMGLRFFLTDDALRERWVHFLDDLEQQGAPRLVDPRAIEHRTGPLKLPGTPRRGAERRTARFRVQIADEEALQSFYTRNLSRGGMFIATTSLLEPGTRVEINIQHPITRAAFALQTEVRWTTNAGPEEEWGMGLEVVPSEGRDGEAFLQFINGA